MLHFPTTLPLLSSNFDCTHVTEMGIYNCIIHVIIFFFFFRFLRHRPNPYESIIAHVSAEFMLRSKKKIVLTSPGPPHAACLSSLSSCQRTLQTYKSWSAGECGGARTATGFFKRWEPILYRFDCKCFAMWHLEAFDPPNSRRWFCHTIVSGFGRFSDRL